MTSKDKNDVRLNPPPRVRSIQPVVPHRTRGRDQATSGRRPSQPLAWTAILFLVVVAIVVVFFLPRWVDGKGGKTETAPAGPAVDSTEPAASNVVPDPAENAAGIPAETQARLHLKERTRVARRQATSLQKNLETKAASLWGAAEMGAAATLMATGEEQLGRGELSLAEKSFRKAAGLLETLDGRSLQVLQESLASGQWALANGDAATATTAYSLALKLDPANQTAAAGVKRAQVLDLVLGLLDTGNMEEQEGDLDAALVSYRKAAALDPLSPPAQEALARVQARMSDDVFAASMSRGLAALSQGDYAGARRFLDLAASQRPGTSQVAEALAQVDEAEKLRAMGVHRDRAVQLEKDEDWEQAATEYQAVLQLDPTITFAQQGRQRTLARARTFQTLQYHVDHPERLSADKVYTEVAEFLEEASLLQPSGPHHQQQLNSLRELLSVAATPVRVFLESDNRTEVTVYKVGRLGTFERHELELRPGTYTVVGSRNGYRDVRRQLVVQPGGGQETLVVQCEEKI